VKAIYAWDGTPVGDNDSTSSTNDNSETDCKVNNVTAQGSQDTEDGEGWLPPVDLSHLESEVADFSGTNVA
jgi:hypothetical protein